MPTTAIDILRANYSRRTDLMSELRAIDEAANSDRRAYTDEETAQIADFRSQLEEVDGRIVAALDIETRSHEIEDGFARFAGALADRESGRIEDTRSLGEQFTDDDFRSWAEGGARGQSPVLTVAMDFRTVTDVTLGATSAGALTRPDQLARIGRDFLDRRVFLADLLPRIAVSQAAVEYVQDQTPLADMANKAVEVAEGGAKPQAGPTLAVVSEPVATVAAWANLTRQAAADVPQVQGYLDERLRYAVRRRADLQAISGNGTLPNLKGLANRSGIVTYTPGAAEDRYKTIRHGIRLLEDVESVPEIIVLNPADAELFDLSNDTSNGLHAVPNVAGPGARTAWGLTQVRSTAIAAGTALLIDPMATAILDRQQVTSYMTDSHASNFTSNILSLLLEARLGLALFDPTGVAKLTFVD